MITITYKPDQCELNDAEFSNYKKAVQAALEKEFPNAEINVGTSDFCNSTQVYITGDFAEPEDEITIEDVEKITRYVFESYSWWPEE
jgi:hypothetical protein